jgi:hypothetical protein
MGQQKMIARKLLWGALMLGIGAAFTFGLGAALQQRATNDDTPSYQPGAPPAVADGKRGDQNWMF